MCVHMFTNYILAMVIISVTSLCAYIRMYVYMYLFIQNDVKESLYMHLMQANTFPSKLCQNTHLVWSKPLQINPILI